MKTTDITCALRNSTTPAARLAAWQGKPFWNRRKMLAEYYDKTATLSARRKAIIDATGPELSATDAEKPLLWLSGTNDPAIADWTAGRDYLDHRGWYADEYQDETLETYAVTLKAFPRLVFYAVKSDGGLRVELSEWEEIDFSDCESDYQADDARRETAKEVIRSNDSSTESEAEESQEFYRKERAERDIADIREKLAGLRLEISALAHELKQPGNRATPDAPLVRAACARLREMLRDRREMIHEMQELTASL